MRRWREAQVVMMLRIQKERLAGLDLDLGDYIARYQLNGERLAASAPKALVMHPGPMIRGLEISDEVADGPKSAIEEQVAHGLAVRTALLVRALGAERIRECNGMSDDIDFEWTGWSIRRAEWMRERDVLLRRWAGCGGGDAGWAEGSLQHRRRSIDAAGWWWRRG